jgi:squalene-hopene cyclase-like protein/prenyltransferase/squalene oxidase-like repeat protein
MTWELCAWALLAVVLAGGIAWYERSHPPARTVALVAGLAALAVAGRLVLAPIPNVVATTDIVLISGYAVGAGPGFAVGALAAAVSNLWLGQGPWTPWQMAGWGMVGAGGAGLALLTGRRLGRLGLAAACGAAGLAYGALLDFSVMVTYGGEQSLDRYLAISARGIPFNVAHAVGNVVLALAAGPALVGMISRYRSRFEFTWHKATAASASLLLAVALALAPAHAEARVGSSGTGWLERAQNRDGGFGPSPGAGSSAAITGWAVLGLESGGRNPLDLRRGGHSAIGYLRSQVASLRSTGDLERTILALRGAGVSPQRFGGRDLVADLRGRRSPGGSFEGQVNLTAFGILALRAAGAPDAAVRRSAAWLRRAQNGDGGWGFQPDASSEPDSTGAALQGLAAASGGTRALRRGVIFLRRAQRANGGFALAAGGPTNSQSTAWAVQGMVAAGANPAARSHGNDPLEYLANRQAPDGHYRYSSASDQTPVWVTGQVLLAVNRKAFPLAAVPRAPVHRRSAPQPAQDGGGPAAGSGRRSEGAPGVRGGGGRQADTSQRAAGAAGELAAGEAVSSRSATDPSPDEGRSLTAYVGAGFALLAAALVGGYFWYRRRLP